MAIPVLSRKPSALEKNHFMRSLSAERMAEDAEWPRPSMMPGFRRTPFSYSVYAKENHSARSAGLLCFVRSSLPRHARPPDSSLAALGAVHSRRAVVADAAVIVVVAVINKDFPSVGWLSSARETA